ncbi:hypothetical protein E5D57_006199 [Metarhizium anisopliae]|nr:hypothetical protein E5D57_006199 [Metarhizium anisopliae]
MKHKVPRILLPWVFFLVQQPHPKTKYLVQHTSNGHQAAPSFAEAIKVEKLDSHNYKANLHAAFSIGAEEVESVVLEEIVEIKTTLNFWRSRGQPRLERRYSEAPRHPEQLLRRLANKRRLLYGLPLFVSRRLHGKRKSRHRLPCSLFRSTKPLDAWGVGWS